MTIEELAFKDYQELKDIQKIDLLLIIEFLQKDRKQWINQYSTAHNDYVDLQRQYQQLKEIEQDHQKLNGELRGEIKELKEDIEDYERIFDIWNKRPLINRFNKEYSKKVVKKERAKGNKIVGAIPDAEYVYKKYYEKIEQLDLYKSVLEEVREYIKTNTCWDLRTGKVLEILDKVKEYKE